MQKDSLMPNKYKKACSDTGFFTGVIKKKAEAENTLQEKLTRIFNTAFSLRTTALKQTCITEWEMGI